MPYHKSTERTFKKKNNKKTEYTPNAGKPSNGKSSYSHANSSPKSRSKGGYTPRPKADGDLMMKKDFLKIVTQALIMHHAKKMMTFSLLVHAQMGASLKHHLANPRPGLRKNLLAIAASAQAQEMDQLLVQTQLVGMHSGQHLRSKNLILQCL